MKVFLSFVVRLTALVVTSSFLLTFSSSTSAQSAVTNAPQPPHLGIRVRDESPVEKASPPVGLIVINIVPSGLAERAGILKEDKIISVNDKAVTTSAAFAEVIQSTPVASTVKLEIVRAGKAMTVMVHF